MKIPDNSNVFDFDSCACRHHSVRRTCHACGMQYAYSYRQNDNFNATTGLTAEQCNYKLLIQKLNRESLHALTCTLLQAMHDKEGSMFSAYACPGHV